MEKMHTLRGQSGDVRILLHPNSTGTFPNNLLVFNCSRVVRSFKTYVASRDCPNCTMF